MAPPAKWRRRRGNHRFAALFSGNLVAPGHTTRKDRGSSRGSLGARRSGERGEGGRGRGVNCSEPSPTLHLPAANLCVHSGGQTGACVSMGETPTREKTKVTSAG